MRYDIIYLFLINVFTFCIFGLDKHKARRHKWRIAEKHLFLLAILGGSMGAEAGMLFFRHKTKHARFVFGIPLILILQIILYFLTLQNTR